MQPSSRGSACACAQTSLTAEQDTNICSLKPQLDRAQLWQARMQHLIVVQCWCNIALACGRPPCMQQRITPAAGPPDLL